MLYSPTSPSVYGYGAIPRPGQAVSHNSTVPQSLPRGRTGDARISQIHLNPAQQAASMRRDSEPVDREYAQRVLKAHCAPHPTAPSSFIGSSASPVPMPGMAPNRRAPYHVPPARGTGANTP